MKVLMNMILYLDGYTTIRRKWNSGDKIILSFNMPVKLIKADNKVSKNRGERAIQRGPLVYCLEQTDNKNIHPDELFINQDITFSVLPGEGKLENLVILSSQNQGNNLTFISYLAWDNR